jgi:hypothetical protein
MGAGSPARQPAQQQARQHATSETRSLQFVAAARTLAKAARAQGLEAPAFRSPPRLVGFSRSLTRRRGAGTTVAVLLWGRPWAAVLADMIEGVIAANRLQGVAADRCRRLLWTALDDPDAATAEHSGTGAAKRPSGGTAHEPHRAPAPKARHAA